MRIIKGTNIPDRINERLKRGVRKFLIKFQDAEARYFNESDTVLMITNALNEMFGFDKHSEIISEYAISSNSFDLATSIDGVVQYLVKVKAVGTELKEEYLEQIIDYSVNNGINWIILTNGLHWIVYRIAFLEKITKEQVVEFTFPSINLKLRSHLELLFSISKEGCINFTLDELHYRLQFQRPPENA